MKPPVTVAATVVLAISLAGCGSGQGEQSEVSTSRTTSSATSKPTTTASSRATTTTFMTESAVPATSPPPRDSATALAPASATASVPTIPPFMRPEEFDPYGQPRFVRCWESNAAVMTDGSIVTDTVNCAPESRVPQAAPYTDPPRTDGCVGPAATCGYYDENGNPIWFDKKTGQTSPRYFDEFGNPTMEPN